MNRWLAGAVKVNQPETIPPVIYKIFKWDCQLPFLPAGGRTLDYDIKHSEKCFILTLLVIYKSGLKNTRFLLLSKYHPLHTGTSPLTLHPTLASFDLFVSLLNVYALQGPWQWEVAIDSHVLWRLVSGQTVLCWISLKHRRSSRLCKVEVHFLGLGFLPGKIVLCGRITLEEIAQAELSNSPVQGSLWRIFLNIFIYFCTHTYTHTHTYTSYTFCLETQKESCNLMAKAKKEE